MTVWTWRGFTERGSGTKEYKVHGAAGQQGKDARSHERRKKQPAHGRLMGSHIAPPGGADCEIEIDQDDDRQDVDEAERAKLTDVVDPETRKRNQTHQCNPDVSDPAMPNPSFRQEQLRGAQQQRGNGSETVRCYKEAVLIERGN